MPTILTTNPGCDALEVFPATLFFSAAEGDRWGRARGGVHAPDCWGVRGVASAKTFKI